MSVHYSHPSSLHSSTRIPYPPSLQQPASSASALGPRSSEPIIRGDNPHAHRHVHHHPNPSSIPMKPAGLVERVPQKRRRRTTPAELAILEDAFKEDPLPDAKRRAAIASRIGDDMNPRNVQIWFQNRRQKEKNMKDTIDKIIAKHEQAGTNPHDEVAMYTESQQQHHNHSMAHDDSFVESDSCSSLALLRQAAKASKSPVDSAPPRRPLEDKENIPPYSYQHQHYPPTVPSQHDQHDDHHNHHHHYHHHHTHPYQSRNLHHQRPLHRTSPNTLRRSYSANSTAAWPSIAYRSRSYNHPLQPPALPSHRPYRHHHHHIGPHHHDHQSGAGASHLPPPLAPYSGATAALPSIGRSQANRRSSVELTTTLDGSASVVSTPHSSSRSEDYLQAHAPLISKIESDPPSAPDEDDESIDQFSRVKHSARAAPHIDAVFGTPKLHSSPFIRTNSKTSPPLNRSSATPSSHRPGATCSTLARAPTSLRSTATPANTAHSSRFEPRELSRSISTSQVPFASKTAASDSFNRRSSFPPTASSRSLQKTASLDVIASRQASAIRTNSASFVNDDEDDEDDDDDQDCQQLSRKPDIRRTSHGSYKRNSSCEITDTESEMDDDDDDKDISAHFQHRYRIKRPALDSSSPPLAAKNPANDSASKISKSSLQAILSPSVATSPPATTLFQANESTMRSSQQSPQEKQQQQSQLSSVSSEEREEECARVLLDLGTNTSFGSSPSSPPSSQPTCTSA